MLCHPFRNSTEKRISVRDRVSIISVDLDLIKDFVMQSKKLRMGWLAWLTKTTGICISNTYDDNWIGITNQRHSKNDLNVCLRYVKQKMPPMKKHTNLLKFIVTIQYKLINRTIIPSQFGHWWIIKSTSFFSFNDCVLSFYITYHWEFQALN